MVCKDVRAASPSCLPAVPEAVLLLPSFHFKKKKKLEKRNTDSESARLLRGSRIEIQPQKSRMYTEKTQNFP